MLNLGEEKACAVRAFTWQARVVDLVAAAHAWLVTAAAPTCNVNEAHAHVMQHSEQLCQVR